jgi:hypothetical protein
VTARKPVRSMKARRSSRVACGHYVHTGQVIISRGEGWRRAWICRDCALLEVAAIRETITEGKRP